MKTRLAKAITASVVARGIGSCAGLLLTVCVTRLLSVDHAGQYFASVSAAMIISAFGRLGLDTVLLRETSEPRGVRGSAAKALLLQSARVCLAFLTASGALVSAVALYVMGQDEFFRSGALAIFMLSASLTVLGLSAEALRGQGRSALSFLLQYASWPTLTALAAIVMATNDAAVILRCAAASSAVSAALSFGLAHASLPQIPDPLTNRPFSPWLLVRKGRTFLLATILNQANNAAVPLLLAALTSATAVAELAVAFRIASILGLLLTAANAVSASPTSSAFKEGRIFEIEAVNRRAATLTLLITAPLGGFILFFNTPLLSQFGEGYQEATTALTLLVLAQLLNVGTGAVGQTLLLCGKQKTAVRNLALGSGVTLTLAVLLSGPLQATGAAIAIAAGTVTTQLLNLRSCKNDLGVRLSPLLPRSSGSQTITTTWQESS